MLARNRALVSAAARGVVAAPLAHLSPSFATSTATSAATAEKKKIKTGIAMLNMGGPEKVSDVESFLVNLFSDEMIINLGRFQRFGAWAARKRAPKIAKQYEQIGGSPLRKWTQLQGDLMAARLDTLSPSTAPHRAYPMFRYAAPFTEDALAAMAADGVERAVAFSQYPMYSCTTTGSSLAALWRALAPPSTSAAVLAAAAPTVVPDAQWSVIDRWHDNPTFIKAVKRRIELGLAQFPPEVDRSKVTLLFSAHSLPMKVVAQGDSYAHEVAHTVQLVMAEHKWANPYVMAWQSKVGFLPWLVPSTADSLTALGKEGIQNVLVIPIAFTSDHVETLFEIDIEYAEHAKEAGIGNFRRAPSLNDEPLLIEAQAQLVAAHLAAGENYSSKQYPLRCFNCVSPDVCRTVQRPAAGPCDSPETYVN